jgi:metallo-beta-lactamase family protein
MESTYGNKLHPDNDPKFDLETYINNAIQQGGTVIIPSFAVERTQSVMYLIWQLKKEGKLPDVPFVIDTPMGASVLDVFMENKKWHKLSETDIIEMSKVFAIISDYKDTLDMIANPLPKVIIAASGMATGGRVLSYLERYIGLRAATILIVGYQAEGTRGRKLLDGATEIKIYGRYHPVLAKILEVQGLSAHGDQKDLLNWLSELGNKPKKVFLIHGENLPADELRIKIREKYGFNCMVPLMGQELEL